jgi:Flp pilus assembly protein TadD
MKMKNKERFEELLGFHFDGNLSKAEQTEFEEILLASDEARRILAQAAMTHVEITRELGVELPNIRKQFRRHMLKKQIILWGSIAALFILGIPFMNLLIPATDNQFMILRNGIKSETVSKPPAGVRCFAKDGSKLTTENGTEVKFLSASVFTMLQNKSKKTRETVQIIAGQVRVNVAANSSGVKIITPEGALRDIGTEFEVGVNYSKDEGIMLKQLRLKRIKPIVTALVLSGIVEFQSNAADASPLKITPEMGKIELSADYSIGKVLDREGNALVKPCNGTRWSIASKDMMLEEKDWLKTGSRGANALALRMKNGTNLILGPNTLIEITDAANIKMFRGELEVNTPKGVSLKVSGPDGTVQLVTNKTSVFRAGNNTMSLLKQIPEWLKGYKNNQSSEAMGSLLANVDGRNVSLTIGYHKVTVDIRDQIARTVIEESFVNHTGTVLEGVFYFPLPQDASISGFGMWIGNRLVHGEIVEKERAREIYETILREKRDPGLLEWTGGNIFKARVYPINAEKRIKITYTQVLPKIGNKYNYNYSLQSEMLKLHPLKKLEITVNVNSKEPLASVTSASHMCRTDITQNSAKIEFEAEEYTPKRDFEVSITTRSQDKQAIVIPHRRADNGYFMLLINAPSSKQKITRDLLVERKPMKFIVMADTSGSVNGTQRKSQLAFIESLLSSLGNNDVFNLMTFDVEPKWISDTMLKNTAKSRAQALKFVDKRHPLGWTDLDKAFRSVFDRVEKDTVVIFVGDGIITTGAVDPQAFCKRLKELYPGNGSFHAVAPGSTYESSVLKTIASFGGSWRAIGGGTDPARAAYELLKQATTLAIRDLKIRFEGLDVAAVYPGELPNLPTGTQQIVIGRYNPAAGNTKGKVAITGKLNGKPVSYSADIILENAEKGNSFIPRLWARKHLNFLLAQGRTTQIKNQIITLSEDYQIITPYTSFLVLESEEDRERFAVKKRFRMRDGEEFFAKGRDNANYELVRTQMLRAKKWRLRLMSDMRQLLSKMEHDVLPQMTGQTSSRGNVFNGRLRGISSVSREISPQFSPAPCKMLAGSPAPEISIKKYVIEEEKDQDTIRGLREERQKISKYEEKSSEAAPDKLLGLNRRKRRLKKSVWDYSMPILRKKKKVGRDYARSCFKSLPSPGYIDPGVLNRLFPRFPNRGGTVSAKERSVEVAKLLERINRRKLIQSTDSAFEIETVYFSRDRYGKKVPGGTSQHYISSDNWLEESTHLNKDACSINWLFNKERGIVRTSWLLGRIRKGEDSDKNIWSAPFEWFFKDISHRYNNYNIKLNSEGANKLRLTISNPHNKNYKVILIIDPIRNVILEARTFGKKDIISSRTSFSGFQKIGGIYWPTRLKTRDKDGKIVYERKISVKTLSPKALQHKISNIVKKYKEKSILLKEQQKTLVEALQAVEDKTAQFEDRWFLLNYYLITKQQSELVIPQFKAIEEMMSSKWGLNRIRLEVFRLLRKLDEQRKLLMSLAEELASEPRNAEFSIANDLISLAWNLNRGNERKLLLDKLKPVFERAGEGRMLYWENQMISALQNMGRYDEVFKWRKALAKKYPDNYSQQVQYANALASRGDIDLAISHLKKSLNSNIPWKGYEIQQLNATIVNILFNARRLNDIIKYIDKIAENTSEQINQNEWNLYLSALIMLDREAEATKLIAQWMTEVRGKDFSEPSKVKFRAAVQHALGQGRDLYHNRIDEDMTILLAKTAESLADYSEDYYLAGQIINNWNFKRTAQGKELHRKLFRKLKKTVSSMKPAQLKQYIRWVKNARIKDLSEKPGEDWQQVFNIIFQRCRTPKNSAGKAILEQLVMSYGELDLRIKLSRLKLQESKTVAEKARSAQILFDLLLKKTWSEKIMEEMLKLLPLAQTYSLNVKPIILKKSQIINHTSLVLNFLKLAKWMVKSKAYAEFQALPDLNKMPRRKLKTAGSNALKDSRLHAIKILRHLENTVQPKFLAPWVKIECIYNQIKLKQPKAEAVNDELMALLNTLIENTANKNAETIPDTSKMLASRIVAMLSFLELKKKSDESSNSSFNRLVDKLIKTGNHLLDWKYVKYQLLVALDRGDELEKCLKEWYGKKDKITRFRWGNHLAQIYAERNQVENAVLIYEDLEKLNALSQSDYRILADWYMVLDKRKNMNEAKIKSWQEIDEWKIRNWLERASSRYQRRGRKVPEEMNPEVPIALIALFRKSTRPQNHIWTLRRLYEATRDFRLLECLPEAVIGQTSQKKYPFLGGLRNVINLLQEEASLDRLKKHIKTVESKNGTKTDERALCLLEFLVEYRGATQNNDSEPHTTAALEAMRKAFKGDWKDGEPELMAAFLANQGALKPEPLLKEQLKELSSLQQTTKVGTLSYLKISADYAKILWNNQNDKAIRILEGAIDAYRNANNGILPQAVNQYLCTLSGYYVSKRRFSKGEAMWLNELSLNRSQQQRNWLKQQLYGLYYQCIVHQGEVSLGKGRLLYRAVHEKMLNEFNTVSNEAAAGSLINILCSIWKQSFRQYKDDEVKKDINKFAFNILPVILNRFNYRNSENMVQRISETLKRICGDLTALEFLVTRAENEPKWLRLRNNHFWQRNGYRISQMRSNIAGKMPKVLSERILAIVLLELREDLRSMRSSQRNIYDINYSYYWKDKEGDYTRTALAVLKKYNNSGPRVKYIAKYLFHGLRKYDLAIDALFVGYRKGIIDVDGRYQLCDYLHRRKRWKESISILKGLIKLRPEKVLYRTMLMRAAFHTGQKNLLNETLRQAVKYCRKNKLWNEGSIAMLAKACLDTKLFEQAVEYYKEVIALHVKTHKNRGIGNYTLSEYYRNLSIAYMKLKRTDDAVDAASGAIISWGNHITNRQCALQSLEHILYHAEDLDAFVKRFNMRVEKTGLENPILRKALGQVFFRKGKYKLAKAQLEAAIAAQPDDVTTHSLLIKIYDKMGKPHKATVQLLDTLKLSEHDISLYKKLASRYTKLKQPLEAERAQTGMVEMLPNESESHQALAKLLQQQKRLKEAEIQWRQVIRIRSKEPTGYLGLAKNLIKQNKKDEARKVLYKLISTSWPKHFGNIRRQAEWLLKKAIKIPVPTQR